MNSRALSVKTPAGELNFTVTHRPRVTRRMHLELDEAGQLRVVVPRDWPDFYTRRLVRQNFDYVQRFLSGARRARLPELHYGTGGQHLFRGRPLTLHVRTGAPRERSVTRHGHQLHAVVVSEAPSKVRQVLQKWYRQQAESLFQERLLQMQQRTPWARDRTISLRLRRMKRTWGTCNRQGVIRLNTHLVKAPQATLDYVICHELCHLREMNHSAAFYELQEQLWPAWRETRAALQREGNRYTQE